MLKQTSSLLSLQAFAIERACSRRTVLELPPVSAMAGPSTADRLEKLEDRVSEWDATLRIRVKGCKDLLAEGLELEKGTREFWKLKDRTGPLLQAAVGDALKGLPPGDIPEHLMSELGQAFHPAGLVGVFPVGGRFDGADVVDIRYRPGLAGFRANFLIATVLSPLLKRVAEPRPLEVWVPLSSAEVKRRDRKRDRSGAPKSRPSRPATSAKR